MESKNLHIVRKNLEFRIQNPFNFLSPLKILRLYIKYVWPWNDLGSLEFQKFELHKFNTSETLNLLEFEEIFTSKKCLTSKIKKIDILKGFCHFENVYFEHF